MMHFIRLTRPLNLIIIALTMYGLGWYLDETTPNSFKFGVRSLDFFLLTFSTVMIAAAGNIINDYFDMRADRINKPHRLIIGKFVKRRVAIVTHWGLNFIAFSIAAYLSIKLETFWYLFIHLLSINILWFYSSYFKRKFLIGNILIAGLTALVPLLVGLYFYQYQQLNPVPTKSFIYPFEQFSHKTFIVWLSFALATFAFILNLAREIVKDMEDVAGDKLLRAKTVPIVLGYQKSKFIISSVLFFSFIAISVFWFQLPKPEVVTFLPVGISFLLVMIAFILLITASEIKRYKVINSFIKLAMVSGLLCPVYWKLIIVYG